MIPVEEAARRIVDSLRPTGSEQVALPAAFGRVLAEDAVARRTQPPFPVSAMDGYAARAADLVDLPARLRCVGYVPAGGAHATPIGPGEAVRIFTGAPLPEGADAIVIQEDTEAEGDSVLVRAWEAGRYVRRAGLDFTAGDVLLPAGRRLTARDIGLAAAMNLPWLRVRRRPRIAILPTGDEVVMPGDPVGANQIVSSNGLALGAFVTALGGEAIDLGIARDDRDHLALLVEQADGVDMLVTSGGASVGEHDLVQGVLGGRGLALDFWRIAMRPGKPLMFGRLGGTPVLGLPGNPVSTIVCAHLFLAPALQAMQGLVAHGPAPECRARLGAPLPANDRRQDYLRARLQRLPEGGLVATPFPAQDSAMMARLAQADALIVRKPNEAAAEAGTQVEILPLQGSAFSV